MAKAENSFKILENYINYNINLNKSITTIKEYRYDLTKFLEYLEFKKRCFLNITSSDIYEYMSHLAIDLKLSPSTRARKLASIKGFFKYSTSKLHIIKENPAKDIEAPKISKRLPKYLSIDESIKLLENVKVDNKNQLFKLKNPDKELTRSQKYLGVRDYAIVTLFLNCGLRLAELVGINISQIKFEEQTLFVIGKGNKQRIIYLNKACLEALINYLKIRPHIKGEDALFLSERKRRISRRMVQTAISEYLKASNLKGYSTHKLRHTVATLLYQSGVDIRQLQEFLGHENISTTEIYTHVENKQLRQAVENNPLSKK